MSDFLTSNYMFFSFCGRIFGQLLHPVILVGFEIHDLIFFCCFHLMQVVKGRYLHLDQSICEDVPTLRF